MSNKDFSPLFWPVKLKKECLLVLDETQLPQKVSYLKIENCRQAAQAIKKMKTRGVGQVILVLYSFLLVFKKNKNKGSLQLNLEKAAAGFNAARPTLAFKYLTDMVLGWQAKKLALDEKILGFLELLKEKRIQQAKEVAGLFESGDVILTHCNMSGLLPLAASFCRQKKKRVSFYVTETRPYLQGTRLTAWELIRQGFAVTVICDNMVAQVMQEAKVNKVVVGADNLAQNGDIANKIGTFQIALLAKEFKIPFYAACPPYSSAVSGEDIKIEVRPQQELFKINNKSVAPAEAEGYYPAFDITPAGLITKHIHLEV